MNVINLDAVCWEEIKKAADESNWIPPEYFQNEWVSDVIEFLRNRPQEPEYVLYGYATPSGKIYASGMQALQNCEQSWVKVYVNKEDLK